MRTIGKHIFMAGWKAERGHPWAGWGPDNNMILLDGMKSGIETDPESHARTPWTVLCSCHDTCIQVATIADGRRLMRNPEVFCEPCRDLKKQHEEREAEEEFRRFYRSCVRRAEREMEVKA